MAFHSSGSDLVFLPRDRVLWVGADQSADLKLARSAVANLAEVYGVDSPAAALASPPQPFVERSPVLILLASSGPGRWSLDDTVALARRWPLAPIVSVAATIVDGRRRSGPALPGIEEVMWHDLPGRLAAWLEDRREGRPGTLGLPATARREESIVENVRPRARGLRVTLAATRAEDLDGLADLAAAAGATVGARTRGRPPLEDDAPALVWDVGIVDGGILTWLRMIVANRPGRRVVLLESFPRPDTTTAALEAGAVAVLGRPCGVEALAGTLIAR